MKRVDFPAFSSPDYQISRLAAKLDSMHRLLIVPVLLFLFVLSIACWGHKQQFYTTVTNNSAAALHSIEVDYPGGSYGIATLPPGESNHKWVFANGPCRYTIRFVDSAGRQYSPDAIDVSKGSCPSGVTLTVDPTMKVTAAATAK